MKSPWQLSWLTWVMHFLFAALMALVIGQYEDAWRAASYPIFFYVLREIDQLLHKLWNKYVANKDVTIDWVDITGDTISAVLGAAAVAEIML